jgi:outer membrane protein
LPDAKDAVRSLYLPNLKNDTMASHVIDTQFIAIPKGELGTAAGVPIPEGTAVLNQSGLSFVTSGTQLTQPLLDLFKVRSANDAAAADTKAVRSKAEESHFSWPSRFTS